MTQMAGGWNWPGNPLSPYGLFMWLAWALSQHGSLGMIKLLTWQLMAARNQGVGCQCFWRLSLELAHFTSAAFLSESSQVRENIPTRQ